MIEGQPPPKPAYPAAYNKGWHRLTASNVRVLTINTGSSSIKAGLYEAGVGGEVRRLGSAAAEDLGDLAAFEKALPGVMTKLGRPEVVGHRLVAPADAWIEPRRLDAAAVAELAALVPRAPDHLPQALAAITCIGKAWSGVPQYSCSDSAFHRTLPEVARNFALPRRLRERGVRRFGFHGLSCEYVMSVLQAEDRAQAAGRIVIAHLGNGASLTAVRGGRSLDTTMGFSPLGGLVMSTRSGDLDPGVLVYLMGQEKWSPEDLNRLLNHESGLLGASGLSGDMKTLLARSAAEPAAAQAVDLFVYQARKFLGALAAALGGVDTLVFTGGIGEHSPEIRGRITEGMDWMVKRVRVLATDEDRMIARHTVAAMRAREV